MSLKNYEYHQRRWYHLHLKQMHAMNERSNFHRVSRLYFCLTLKKSFLKLKCSLGLKGNNEKVICFRLLLHLLMSWYNAAIRGFSKLSMVTDIPSFRTDFSPAWSALKVETTYCMHTLCKSSSDLSGRASRFPRIVSMLNILSSIEVSTSQRQTATYSGDGWYFINFVNLWRSNNVRSCEMVPMEVAQNLWKLFERNKKFKISKNTWCEILKIVLTGRKYFLF